MNEVIKSTVSAEIKKELGKRDEQISKAMQDVFISVGKTQKDQDQITTILGASKTKLQELTTSISDTISAKDKLEDAIEKLNAKALLNKLSYDFYHVRSFSAKASYFFTKNVPDEKIVESGVTIDHVNLNRARGESVEKICEFFGSDKPTMIGPENTTNLIKSAYSVYAMFDEKIYNKHIREFEGINRVSVRLRFLKAKQELIQEILDQTAKIEFVVLVNWMPLWTFQITPAQIAAWQEDDEFKYASIIGEIPKGTTSVIQRYEALFAEAENDKAASEK